MAEVEYLHVCDYAFAAEGGKPCIIGIFDVIRVSNFPATHPVMAVAMRFRGLAHEVMAIKIELCRPNGDVLVTMQADVTGGPDGGAFVQVNMSGTQFPEPGRYTIKVSSAGRTLASHSLQVQKVQPPLQSARPGADPKKFH